ncbi:hypothetical protein [Paractinoplanes hotanensis]|nr:hypothetical protein [Actinoplanes hotanensis]
MTRRWLFADQLGPHFLDAPAREHRDPYSLGGLAGAYRGTYS